MTAPSLSAWFEVPVDRNARARRAHLFNLLSRPVIDEATARRVGKMLGAQDWLPLAPLRLHREMLPLFAAHLESLGIPWAHFSSERPPDLRHIARQHFARLNAIRAVLDQFGQAGIDTVVIKGLAIASHYPTPALRTMCDLDLAVNQAQRGEADRLLQALGWKPSRQIRGVYLGSGGQRLDLQIPATPHAHDVMRRALASNEWPIPNVRVATPSDLALLTAHHAAQHLGERIWRDVCDWRALMGGGERPEPLTEVGERELRECLESFLNILQRLESRQIEAKKTPTNAHGTQVHLTKLFLEMAGTQTHPAALHLMRRITRPWRENLRGIHWRRSLIPQGKEGAAKELATEHLAELVGMARLTAAAWLLAGLSWHGILAHYLRIARLQHRIASLKHPFSTG